MRGDHIKATLQHDAGAYARCSYCGRYSDDPRSLGDRRFQCACGEFYGWSGSFVTPTAESAWSDQPDKGPLTSKGDNDVG